MQLAVTDKHIMHVIFLKQIESLNSDIPVLVSLYLHHPPAPPNAAFFLKQVTITYFDIFPTSSFKLPNMYD
jgi:hypothetical protein